MGNRISISFVNGATESVSLFSHWEGEHLLGLVREYLEGLRKDEVVNSDCGPLSRWEPNTVMVDFLRWLSVRGDLNSSTYESGNLVEVNRTLGNYYLGRDKNHGDNSDNGHYKFHLRKPSKVAK